LILASDMNRQQLLPAPQSFCSKVSSYKWHLAENKISRCLKLKLGNLQDSTEPLFQISLDMWVYLQTAAGK
jgi:hypothetical protein